MRYLSFEGSWDGSLMQVNNLTSFAFTNYKDNVCVETFRLFMLNNPSSESLTLEVDAFEGNAKGPPVNLLDLKSFSVMLRPTVLSRIIRVPALQRLSSIRISHERADAPEIRLAAAGDGIALSVVAFLYDVAEVWQDIAGYAQPTIRHVCLCDFPESGQAHIDDGDGSAVVPLAAGAHTLAVGRSYLTLWYRDFLEDLKQLGSQLEVIRFEVWEEMDPFGDENYAGKALYGHDPLDNIEELVKYRFEIGHPFSVVERIVVGGSERSNRQQDYVWRCFYGDRKLGRYVLSV